MSALTTEDFARAAEWIASWRQPLLVSHEKPDGDALGALVAMRSLLGARGVSATALLFDSMPDQYEVFRRHEPMAVLGHDLEETGLDKHDGVIVFDTCTYTQLRPITDWLRSTTLPKLAIDHHVTREDVADHHLIDQSAAATCLIVYDWARAIGWPIETGVADALFLGMATDTGWFRYSNTDARVLSAAADLAARGGDPHGLYQQLYRCEKPARVRLLGAALSTLELLVDDRLAVMALSAKAIAGAGATRNDTEDIVNEPLRVGSVLVSVLLVEAGDGNIRINLRSKPPTEPRALARADTASPVLPQQGRANDVDVAKVAEVFGGGGHTRAAGARIAGTLPEVHRKIIEHLQAVLSGPPGAKY